MGGVPLLSTNSNAQNYYPRTLDLRLIHICWVKCMKYFDKSPGFMGGFLTAFFRSFSKFQPMKKTHVQLDSKKSIADG